MMISNDGRHNIEASTHQSRKQRQQSGYSASTEKGRQGSPQMSLLHSDRPNVPAAGGQQGTQITAEDSYTYENVASVREKSGLPCSGQRPPRPERRRASNPGNERRKLNSPGSAGDISLTLMNHDVITPDDSPYQRRHKSPDTSVMLASTGTLTSCSSNTYTMTGTLKRGKKKDKAVELELQLTQAEIERLNQSTILDEDDKSRGCACGVRNGPHIVLFSVLFIPCALISSLLMSFYIGTMCWYNIYLCLSEDKTIWHKIFLCPLLILFYPVLIVSVVTGVALYAAFVQVSWSFNRWLKQIRDFEKGFFGWLCAKLGLAECAPYEVIVLQEGGLSPMGGSTVV